jgi:Domain of unknown function (DUF4287)
MIQGIAMSSQTDRTMPRSSLALRQMTGRDRAEWFEVLDAWGAGGRPYREIATYLRDEHGLSNWWAQKLIVEYEEARGLRDPGVRRNGSFEVGASKTISAGERAVLDAFEVMDVRARWLSKATVDEMERAPGRIRFRRDDASRVTVSVSTTAAGRTQVVVQHEKLADAAVAASMKVFWRERLSALKELLEAPDVARHSGSIG